MGRNFPPTQSLVSLLSVTGRSRSSWLLLIGMRELRVEQEDGDGEVSLLLVEREGMLVLRGRPEGFNRPRLSSRWIGETELKHDLVRPWAGYYS